MPITGKSIDGFPFDFVIKQTFLILFLQKLFEMSSRREHREDKGMIGGKVSSVRAWSFRQSGEARLR